MQNKGLKIALTVLRLLIAVLGIVFCAMIVANSNSDDSVVQAMDNFGTALDGAFWLVLIVGVMGAGAAILFGLFHFLSDIKHKIGSLIGIIVFAAVLLLSYYVFASDEVSPIFPEGTTSAVAQFTGGGLIALYIIGGLAVLTIVFAEVSRLFK
jgi:hypothetical protein